MHLYAQGGPALGLRRTEFPITEWPGVSGEVARGRRNDSEVIRFCESGILVKRTRSRSPLTSSGLLLRHAMDRAEAQH